MGGHGEKHEAGCGAHGRYAPSEPNRARCLTCSRLHLETYERMSPFFWGGTAKGSAFHAELCNVGRAQSHDHLLGSTSGRLEGADLGRANCEGGGTARRSPVSRRCALFLPSKVGGQDESFWPGRRQHMDACSSCQESQPFPTHPFPPIPQFSG